jgi:phage gp45-like
MAHRATPLISSFRGFVSGGERALIKAVEDGQLMQAMTGFGLKGEAFSPSKDGSHKGPESPQNYGFTSVVADAVMGANGMVKQCAEGFMSFMGGNRSFPVCSIMDDRRHRLKNLTQDAAKGSVAMFGMKEWGQQLLNTDTGMFMTGNMDKKMRFQLVQNQNGKKQQKQGSLKDIPPPEKFQTGSGVEFEIETFIVEKLDAGGDGSGSSNSGGGQQGDSKPTGQKTLHKEKSDTYVDMSKDAIVTKRGNGFANVKDSISQLYHSDPTHDVRCDSNHVHIGYGANKLWVDSSGVWSSVPIRLRNCYDNSGKSTKDDAAGPPPTSGPPAYTATSPLSLDFNGNMAMGCIQPLKVSTTNPPGVTPPYSGGGSLYLDIAEPLFINGNGQLTSSAGTGAGFPEAPLDGVCYGRQSGAWVPALAKSGDTLDGGTF